MLWLLWVFIVVVLGLPAAAIATGSAAWPFELAYHFIGHLAIVALLAAVVCLILRHEAPAAVAGILALLYIANAVTTSGALNVAEARAAHHPALHTIDLVSFNILADQDDPNDMLTWLAGKPADVLVLQECAPMWRAGLEALRTVYPHQLIATAREDAVRKSAQRAGVAILSRLPLRNTRVIYPGGPDKPAIVAVLDTAVGALTLAAAHPSNPVSISGLASRDKYLAELADELSDVVGPLVVAGDFNATRFTPPFRRFLATLGLSLPRRAPATFPARAGPFGLAIDHVLVRGVRLDRLNPLPPFGSDHRGLLARLALPAD